MLQVELSAVSFLIVLGVSHLMNLFTGWFIHFLQHQKILGIPLYQVHLKAHHEINGHQLTPGDYLKISIGHGLWAILFLGSFALYYLILPTWMTVTAIGNAIFLTAVVYYVHWEYDKPASWLSRFDWFQRGRALHKIHHSYFGETFSRSKNYAFGGPLAGNLMDYLMGTFQGHDASEGASCFPLPVHLGGLVGRIRHALPDRFCRSGRHPTTFWDDKERSVMAETTQQFPRIRKLAWKSFYGFLAWRFRVPEWFFMNYGYHDPDAELALPARDEKNRYFIQLYAQVLGQAGSVAGRDVLEVGCGRGGGSEWIARTQGVRSMTGMDLAGSAVKLCRASHHTANLTFVQGDAERLPFPGASFDVVLNVESCHHYPSLPTFFREVDRVLKPGGHFCVAFYGEQPGLQRFKQAPAGTGLEVVKFSNVTPCVANALRASNEMKMALIKRHVPWYLTPVLKFFAGVEGTEIHRGFTEGRLTYVTSLMRKPMAVAQGA